MHLNNKQFDMTSTPTLGKEIQTNRSKFEDKLIEFDYLLVLKTTFMVRSMQFSQMYPLTIISHTVSTEPRTQCKNFLAINETQAELEPVGAKPIILCKLSPFCN